MINYKNEKEKELLYLYANKFDDSAAKDVLDRGGVSNKDDVKALAKLYWRMVDEAEGDNMEYWLERIYTTLHIHAGNCGFDEEWENEIPD